MLRDLQSRNGIMLISVLWVLAILSLLALMLSRSVTVEQSFLNYSLGRMHSSAAARAGTEYALALLENPEFRAHKGDDELFKHYPVGKMAYVDIEGGITDEEAKINLNALTDSSWHVFINLLEQVKVSKDQAEAITAAVIDWRDENSDVFSLTATSSKIGAENEYYQALEIPYLVKNRPFDCIEELLMVRGMTPAIYGKIKKFITVFPKAPSFGLQINLATASQEVLKAYIQGHNQQLLDKGEAPDVDLNRALNTIEAYRRNPNSGDVNDPTAVAFDGLKSTLSALGQGLYFNIRAQGVDKQRGVRTTIESVWHKDDDSTSQMALKYWRKL